MAHKNQAVLIAQAYERVRDIELQRQAEMEVIRNDALQQLEQTEMDRGRADVTAERLRKNLPVIAPTPQIPALPQEARQPKNTSGCLKGWNLLVEKSLSILIEQEWRGWRVRLFM